MPTLTTNDSTRGSCGRLSALPDNPACGQGNMGEHSVTLGAQGRDAAQQQSRTQLLQQAIEKAGLNGSAREVKSCGNEATYAVRTEIGDVVVVVRNHQNGASATIQAGPRCFAGKTSEFANEPQALDGMVAKIALYVKNRREFGASSVRQDAACEINGPQRQAPAARAAPQQQPAPSAPRGPAAASAVPAAKPAPSVPWQSLGSVPEAPRDPAAAKPAVAASDQIPTGSSTTPLTQAEAQERELMEAADRKEEAFAEAMKRMVKKGPTIKKKPSAPPPENKPKNWQQKLEKSGEEFSSQAKERIAQAEQQTAKARDLTERAQAAARKAQITKAKIDEARAKNNQDVREETQNYKKLKRQEAANAAQARKAETEARANKVIGKAQEVLAAIAKTNIRPAQSLLDGIADKIDTRPKPQAEGPSSKAEQQAGGAAPDGKQAPQPEAAAKQEQAAQKSAESSAKSESTADKAQAGEQGSKEKAHDGAKQQSGSGKGSKSKTKSSKPGFGKHVRDNVADSLRKKAKSMPDDVAGSFGSSAANSVTNLMKNPTGEQLLKEGKDVGLNAGKSYLTSLAGEAGAGALKGAVQKFAGDAAKKLSEKLLSGSGLVSTLSLGGDAYKAYQERGFDGVFDVSVKTAINSAVYWGASAAITVFVPGAGAFIVAFGSSMTVNGVSYYLFG